MEIPFRNRHSVTIDVELGVIMEAAGRQIEIARTSQATIEKG